MKIIRGVRACGIRRAGSKSQNLRVASDAIFLQQQAWLRLCCSLCVLLGLQVPVLDAQIYSGGQCPWQAAGALTSVFPWLGRRDHWPFSFVLLIAVSAPSSVAAEEGALNIACSTKDSMIFMSRLLSRAGRDCLCHSLFRRCCTPRRPGRSR